MWNSLYLRIYFILLSFFLSALSLNLYGCFYVGTLLHLGPLNIIVFIYRKLLLFRKKKKNKKREMLCFAWCLLNIKNLKQFYLLNIIVFVYRIFEITRNTLVFRGVFRFIFPLFPHSRHFGLQHAYWDICKENTTNIFFNMPFLTHLLLKLMYPLLNRNIYTPFESVWTHVWNV